MKLLILAGAVSLLVATLRWIYQRFTRISIRHVRGPPNVSFWLGNLPEYHQNQVGETDFKWMDLYGGIVKYKAPFGEDRLMISDAKALQYIFQTAGYNFPKVPERRELSRIITGRGILYAEADDHKRHRKVMLPGFGGPEAKSFHPIFLRCAEQMSSKWQDIINASPNQASVLNIPPWASRAMLDAIGQAAFDYNFGALDDANNELNKAYSNLLKDTFQVLSRSSAAIFVQNLWAYLPLKVLHFVANHSPAMTMHHARYCERVATDIARDLVKEKADALLEGKGKRDIMSLLVKANASEDPNRQLDEQELYDQMRTIMLAGHETTANTLSWALLELTSHPDMQRRLREEIWEKQRELGGSDIQPADFDSMPYLTAITKEVLRYHPVAPMTQRMAGRDDVLPLAMPIILTTGERVHELPVSKGTKFILSIAGYNRNKDVFGADAQVFNPDRWLGESKASVNVGVYANLLTFSAGIRGCIGFRFAIIELQTFLVELLSKFEFTSTPELSKLRREPCGVMAPTIDGQQDDDAQLPLLVKCIPRID
ncbi:hypothetical protein HGRIS_001673 [Hohenbuehelia grisea]|uniref:Cytochrome P450 n=1 Tax=Hohenbuehelia grisea TaxID=104357 RepID=A0ABR3JJ39_9AGAR